MSVQTYTDTHRRLTLDWWAARLEISPSGCFLWAGLLDINGYGVVPIGRKNRRAHRVLYEQVLGPVPAGLELDHRCQTKACVNPAHLEAVTHQENMRRAYADKTHCAQGHPYTGENVGFRSSGRGRYCRVCARIREAKKRRAAA